ncbi:hypothetical protein, partial [Paraburkholderia sediminicola]|uniref:hypothetical protein n=1 Tax=Paraburkholderia sediminicola TaxID=458836 RepID=UPI0038BA5A32
SAAQTDQGKANAIGKQKQAPRRQTDQANANAAGKQTHNRRAGKKKRLTRHAKKTWPKAPNPYFIILRRNKTADTTNPPTA